MKYKGILNFYQDGYIFIDRHGNELTKNDLDILKLSEFQKQAIDIFPITNSTVLFYKDEPNKKVKLLNVTKPISVEEFIKTCFSFNELFDENSQLKKGLTNEDLINVFTYYLENVFDIEGNVVKKEHLKKNFKNSYIIDHSFHRIETKYYTMPPFVKFNFHIDNKYRYILRKKAFEEYLENVEKEYLKYLEIKEKYKKDVDLLFLFKNYISYNIIALLDLFKLNRDYIDDICFSSIGIDYRNYLNDDQLFFIDNLLIIRNKIFVHSSDEFTKRSPTVGILKIGPMKVIGPVEQTFNDITFKKLLDLIKMILNKANKD